MWAAIQTILGFFKGNKWAQYITMATIVIGALGATTDFIYTAGQNSVISEYNEKMLEATQDHNKELREALEKQKAELNEQTEKRLEALRNENALNESTREIVREVFVTEFVCDNLGDDFLRLFNNPIRNGNALVLGVSPDS